MHKVSLTYSLGAEASADLQHPLVALLDAVHRTGSISGAARDLGLSYRHVWGELKRWEVELGRPLVHWNKGQPALLSPFGEKLMWAERRARARLAPQIDALRSELELAFALAFDDTARIIALHASHDEALPRLRELAQREHKLLLDIRFGGSVDALTALNDRRCLVAGFHAIEDPAPDSLTARTYRALLHPGRHKLIGFVRRTQGLMVAPGNPLDIRSVGDLRRAGLRLVQRGPRTGTRIVLDELLRAARLPPVADAVPVEPSHRAVAAAVASGSADVGFGIEAAARGAGLDFVALAHERYFLVTLADHLDDPQLQALREVLRTPSWQRTLATIPGHAADCSGDVLSLRRVLPWWTYRRPKERRSKG